MCELTVEQVGISFSDVVDAHEHYQAEQVRLIKCQGDVIEEQRKEIAGLKKLLAGKNLDSRFEGLKYEK